MADTTDQETLARILREQTHRLGHGPRSLGSTVLCTAWSGAGLTVRARILGRLAWYARSSHAVALTDPFYPPERLASAMCAVARQYDALEHVCLPPTQMDADWLAQLQAALVLLAACPNRNRHAALTVAPERAQ